MDKTKKCPLCAEEIKAEARLCRFCKAEFKVGWRGYCTSCHEIMEVETGGSCPKCGGELIDRTFTSQLLEEVEVPPAGAPPAAASTVHPSAPAVAAAPTLAPEANASSAYVKQGLGASLRQYIGMIAIDVSAFVLFISWIFGFASKQTGYLTEKTNGPVAFLIIPVILLILAATLEQSPFFGNRYSRSNLKKSRGSAKSFRASARELGFTTVFRQQLWPKAIALLIIGLGTLGIWIYNYNDLSNQQNISFNTGAWMALVAAIAIVLGSLMLIPTSRNKQVVIDTEGSVHLLEQAGDNK
jgi:hypothetical protein